MVENYVKTFLCLHAYSVYIDLENLMCATCVLILISAVLSNLGMIFFKKVNMVSVYVDMYVY